MSYDKQTWADGSGGGTPITAARLGHIEDGIEAAHDLGTSDATPDTIVRRAPANGGDLGGWAEFSAVGLGTAPSLPHLATRKDYVDELFAQAATLEELDRAHAVGTISATTTVRLAPASFDQRIGSITLAASAAVAASDTNYWTISLLRLRAGASAQTITSRTTKTTGGEAFTADQGWNFDAATWLETLRHLRKGDVLALAFTKTAAATNLSDVTVAVRYEPNVRPVVRDTFARVDSTSGLGTTDTGQAWEAPLTGTFGINAEQGSVLSLAGGYAYDVFDSGLSDFTYSVKISTAGTGQGAVFRSVDYNNLFDFGPNGVFKTAGGVVTNPVAAISGGVATGDVLTVVASGPSISVYKNGILVGSFVDSFNQTATRVGVWANGTASRFDNIELAV